MGPFGKLCAEIKNGKFDRDCFFTKRRYLDELPYDKLKNVINYWKKNYFSEGSKFGYLCDWR